MRLMRSGWARPQLIAGAAAAATITIAACGGGGTSTPSASPGTRSPSASAMPSTGAAGQAAVKAAWLEFFNGRTSTARRVLLLENGPAFSSLIASQARQPTVAAVSAQVNSVSLVSPTEAKVTYTVLQAGSPVLANQSGVAVYQNGTWKVTTRSFCGLLTLETGGSTASLPGICRGSGG